MNDSQADPAKNPLLGDILVIGAQFFLSLQMVTEEKFVGQFDTHPLEVVGLEGVSGLTLIISLLAIFQVTLGNSGETGNIFDVRFGWPSLSSPSFALGELSNRISPHSLAMALFAEYKVILIPSVILMMSYGVTNFCGVYTTKILGATARTTIEQCRTLVVWIFGIGVGWET